MDFVFLRDLALTLLGFVLSLAGTVLLRRYFPLLRSREEFFLLQTLASVVVQAVEQMAGGRGMTGEEKKLLALSMVREGLERMGIEVSDSELEAAIEAAVRSLGRG